MLIDFALELNYSHPVQYYNFKSGVHTLHSIANHSTVMNFVNDICHVQKSLLGYLPNKEYYSANLHVTYSMTGHMMPA